MNKLILILLGCLLPIAIFSQTVPRYLESGGIVIIELESAISYGEWELDSTRVGYTGKGYLHYKGDNHYNDPGNSLLKFEIVIEKTGKYRFQWHSLIAMGTSNTEHNDSWLRFHDASDFYGEKNGQKVYPKGVGKTPNPAGSSSNGWMKIYQNSLNNWTWSTRTSDRDPHEIYVEFDSAGVYTIEISGRSTGHAINRLALYHGDANPTAALSLAWKESERVQNTSIKDIPFRVLKIRPTLAENMIYVDVPLPRTSHEYEGEIVNVLGQKIQSFSIRHNSNNEVAIPIDHLGKGIYFLRFTKDAMLYQGKFVKK